MRLPVQKQQAIRLIWLRFPAAPHLIFLDHIVSTQYLTEFSLHLEEIGPRWSTHDAEHLRTCLMNKLCLL